MKVGILTQYYPPEIGAPQARLSALAEAMARKGHEVYVLTALPNYPGGKIYQGYNRSVVMENRNGVKVIRCWLYATQSVGLLARLACYVSFAVTSWVVGIVNLPKLDYLITESPPLLLGITGYLLSCLKQCRWIFNVSDLWPESAVRLGIIRSSWMLKLARRLELFCYQKAWLVSAQSREIVQYVKNRCPDARTYYFPNSVDPAKFSPDRRTDAIRAELAGERTCVALYAGLHGIAQGLEQILMAAQKLLDLKELGIVFIGDGSQRESLIKQCRELALTNVRFVDPKPYHEIPLWIASADIALVPLGGVLPGAVPSKLYEAMGSGVSTVLIADGEAAKIVRQAEAGVVLPPGDIDSIAMALRDLVAHKDKRVRMGDNGRKAALERFSREGITTAYAEFMEENLRC